MTGKHNVGLAVLRNTWNVDITNIRIHSVFCGIYIGITCTSVLCTNVYLTGGSEDYSGMTAPSISANSTPPYVSPFSTSALILEAAKVTFVGCTFEAYGGVIIGERYNAYFENPYFELISDFFVWLYSDELYSPIRPYKVTIKGFQYGVFRTNFYSFGTNYGLIEVFDSLYARCYTPPSLVGSNQTPTLYLIHYIADGGASGLWYDDWTEVGGVFSNPSKCPYKKIVVDGKSDVSEMLDVYVRPENTGNDYQNALLLTGFSSVHPTTPGEVFKREYDHVMICPIRNDTDFESDVVVTGKKFGIKTIPSGSQYPYFKSAVQMKNCDISFLQGQGAGEMTIYARSGVTHLFELQGDARFLIGVGTTLDSGFSNDGGLLFSIVAEQSVSAIVEHEVSNSGYTSPSRRKIYQNLANVTSDYPFRIHYVFRNVDTGETIITDYTNTARPTKGIPTGYVYFDTALGKSIVWNGSVWVNMDGTAL